jgi:hypothetical protein
MNLLCLPLIYSLVYQKFRSGERFFWAACAATAVILLYYGALLVWGGMYHLIRWKYYYGFALYLAMAAGRGGGIKNTRNCPARPRELRLRRKICRRRRTSVGAFPHAH